MIRQLFLIGLLALGALSGLVQGETLASFTSAATDTANTFSAGTVNLTIGSPVTTGATLGEMVPGEMVTGPVTVTNSGSLPMRYAISSSVTNPDGKAIGAQLDLTIKQGVTTCTNAGFGASGTVVYGTDGPLGAIGSNLNLVGNPASYPNGGRALAAGANETLCIQIKLPAASSTAYQGASTAVTFMFDAQQS